MTSVAGSIEKMCADKQNEQGNVKTSKTADAIQRNND